MVGSGLAKAGFPLGRLATAQKNRGSHFAGMAGGDEKKVELEDQAIFGLRARWGDRKAHAGEDSRLFGSYPMASVKAFLFLRSFFPYSPACLHF